MTKILNLHIKYIVLKDEVKLKLRSAKVLKWLLAVVLGIWFVVSVFFYFQHSIQVESYSIEKYIEFEKFGVLVKNIEKRNFEENRMHFSDNSYIARLDLPSGIISTIYKINYFYSIPYHIDNEKMKYDINCEVIFDQNVIDAESVGELVGEELNIELFNNTSGSYIRPSGHSREISSAKNIIHCSYRGNWSQNNIAGVKIINENNGEEHAIKFDKQFLINKYSFFNPVVPERKKRSDNLIYEFIWNYYKQDSRFNIEGKYVEDFPWDNLKKYEDFTVDNYEFSYLGQYMGDDQVFVMKVLENNPENLPMKELEFHMVYKNLNWKIIDVK